jgi:putative ubiquitin-RnfH superfamily antitoxin RatB of RatAB toxin-antitoxin module
VTDIEPISVEVAYALPDKQKIVSLMVEPGTTAQDAVYKSHIDQEFPGLDLKTAKLGIFGQVLGAKGLAAASDYVLKEGDRVEIYRELTADPKEVRRRRAEKTKK